jgi:hypothetical protein
MLETGTSGLMSGEGKRIGYLSVPITRPSSTLQARHAACTHGYAVHPMFDL